MNYKKSLHIVKLLPILVLFYLSSTVGFSQEKEIDSLRNEIKLGALSLLAGPALNVEYERIISKYSSFGGNLFVGLNNVDYQYNLAISPYYRMYFSRSREYGTKGFFVQGFASFLVGENQMTDFYMNTDDKKNYSDAALGFALGTKWVNKGGFVFQICFGVGRTLGFNDYSPEFVLVGDFSVGFRF